jgi:signal transduction histidine kinase
MNAASLFSDSTAFEELTILFAPIVTRKAPEEPIWIWVPACGNGADAYTLALVFQHLLNRQQKVNQLEVWGTDTNPQTLSAARQGLLAESALANLPTDVKESCFARQQVGYQFMPSLRSRVVFATLDSYCHPPFLKLDLISGRNLPPFAAMGASELSALFYEALNPGGLLLLHPSESPDRLPEGFEADGKAHQRCWRRNVSHPSPASAVETPVPGLRKEDSPQKPSEDTLNRLSALPRESQEDLLAYISALEHELRAARDQACHYARVVIEQKTAREAPEEPGNTPQAAHVRLLQKQNESLEKRAQELVASNAELKRFAYVASHDLQEPLRMIKSFLQLLQKKYQNQLDERADEYIRYAVGGAETMKKLILDLLEYSRVGTSQEAHEQVNLNEVMQYVCSVFERDIRSTEVHIQITPLPSILGNRSQLIQLFQNLIGNALKYHSNQSPRLVVQVQEEEGHWLFSVADNGISIDKAFFEKVFIIFQRLHNKNAYSGTGIGLAICKK